MSGSSAQAKALLYTRFPVANILTYQVVTLTHFLLGATGIIVGYNYSKVAYFIGALYLAFALIQMYVIMPLTVCLNCVYFGLDQAICPSGLNVISSKIAKRGDPDKFASRASGLLCHNNLYLIALILPILAIVPGLVMNFSFLLLAIWLAIVALLLFRFFIIFNRLACLHCKAKYLCPNAEKTGVRER